MFSLEAAHSAFIASRLSESFASASLRSAETRLSVSLNAFSMFSLERAHSVFIASRLSESFYISPLTSSSSALRLSEKEANTPLSFSSREV